ncbi:agmatine deiminase family protein [Bacteroidota bacterium]
MQPKTLIPEWELPKSIGLVWAEDLQDIPTQALVNFFYVDLIKLLIRILPQSVSLTIIHRSDEKQRLINYFGADRINLIADDNLQDIWIRDFAPFWVQTGNKNIAVKTRYYPLYGGKVYLKYAEHDDRIGTKLGGKSIQHILSRKNRIVLDGGNITHNGKGTGICTNRLISDNEHLFKDKVIEAVKEYLGFKELIIVPCDYGDDTGHIDGMVRFISEDSVLVSDYPYEWIKKKKHIKKSEYLFEREQLNEIAEYLNSIGMIVFRMPNGIPLNTKFESAVGNYTNFLRVGEKFFLPKYNKLDQDWNAFKALQKAGIKKNNIIQELDCNDLAELGGVLNCITTHIY